MKDDWRITLAAMLTVFGTLIFVGVFCPTFALASDPQLALPEGVVLSTPQTGDGFLSPFVIACLVIAALCVIVGGLLLWRKR